MSIWEVSVCEVNITFGNLHKISNQINNDNGSGFDEVNIQFFWMNEHFVRCSVSASINQSIDLIDLWSANAKLMEKNDAQITLVIDISAQASERKKGNKINVKNNGNNQKLIYKKKRNETKRLF